MFKDAAFSLSNQAEQAGKKLEASESQQQALKKPGDDESLKMSGDDLREEATEVSQVVGNGVAEVAKDTQDSLADKFSGDEKETLIYRLKQVVFGLRKRPDYSESVSTIAVLIKRYARIYSRAIQETVDTAKDDVNPNPETERALKNF